ncbi:MAG: pyrroline-5-carboxylate reductase [Candidatus Omnitrophica bacterium]|nr:pyrroline-5-carboxylate reductase [Candidatus Omnitrophota bacterium]
MIKKMVGIIGCGNMGQAILAAGLKNKDLRFLVCEKKEEIVKKLKDKFGRYEENVKFKDISEVVQESDVVIVAVKPQDIEGVLQQMHQFLEWRFKKLLVVSIVAGIKIEYLEEMLGEKIKVIRAMPNIAITVEEGITAFKRGRLVSLEDLKIVQEIFSSVGKTLEIKNEELMDVITAISGSGPAYVAYIVNAILKSADSLGLERDSSRLLVYQTFLGTLKFLKENNFDTEDIISKVASKGGTTEQALKVFKNCKLEQIIQKAVVSAYKRAKEISC